MPSRGSTSEQRNMREVKLLFPVGLQVFDFNNSSRHLAARCRFKDSSRHLVACANSKDFSRHLAAHANSKTLLDIWLPVQWSILPSLLLPFQTICMMFTLYQEFSLSSAQTLPRYWLPVLSLFFCSTDLLWSNCCFFQFHFVLTCLLILFSIYNNFVCWPLTFGKSYKNV